MNKGYDFNKEEDRREIIEQKIPVLNYCPVCKLYFQKLCNCEYLYEKYDSEEALACWRYGKL